MRSDSANHHSAAHDDRESMVERRERLLDDALMQSFPASDPPSICLASAWTANVQHQWRRRMRLDKGGTSSIFNIMSERSQVRRPQLHPASSTARF